MAEEGQGKLEDGSRETCVVRNAQEHASSRDSPQFGERQPDDPDVEVLENLKRTRDVADAAPKRKGGD